MDDLAAVAATIQAAQIQANYALWAAVIGAFGVVIAVYFTAKNTIKQIKLEKVAESKRDQYIALTESYTQYLVSSLTISTKNGYLINPDNIEINKGWSEHLAKYIELLGCINKVNLITTSEIRIELFKIEKELTAYQESIANYYLNSVMKKSSEELEQRVFEFGKLLRKDLGIQEDSKTEAELIRLRDASSVN